MPLAPKDEERLASCDPRLRAVAIEAAKHVDFGISYGHRGREDQHVAFLTGKSKLDWPHSRHNAVPSEAFDFFPRPLNWDDLESFAKVAAEIKVAAGKLGIAVTWGGDWTTFKDFPHIELTKMNSRVHFTR